METFSQIYRGRSNASFGEIVQGVLPNDDTFLITLPIKIYADAVFVRDDRSVCHYIPAPKTKVRQLVNLIEQKHKIQVRGTFNFFSDIPVGKGLSSSTADLVACSYAVSDAYHLHFSPTDIDCLLRFIEPSDALAHAGIVAYNYKKCQLIKKMSPGLPLVILGIDEGYAIDTVDFNKKNRSFSEQQKNIYSDLLWNFERACQRHDLKAIGKIATESTLIWQNYSPKQNLGKAMALLNDIDGLGIVNTHSGAFLGILLDMRDPFLSSKIRFAKKYFKEINVYESIYHYG